MADNVTNELIFETLKRLREDMNSRLERVELKIDDVGQKLIANREHIGAQQMDISTIYTQLNYLSAQVEHLRKRLPQTEH